MLNMDVPKVESELRYCMLHLLLGAMFVVVSFMILFSEWESSFSIRKLLGVFAIISGLVDISFTYKNRDCLIFGSWYIFGGCIDLLVGILFFSMGDTGIGRLHLILFFWMAFRGFSGMGMGFDLKQYGARDWGLYVILPFIVILFSLGIVLEPADESFSFWDMTAYAFLVLGIYRILLSFKMKNLHLL